jgi:hypothetical protein
MWKHIRFLIIFAVVSSISTTYLVGITNCNLAFACECVEPTKSPEEAFSEAEAVFSGKVTAIAVRAGQFDSEKVVSLDVERAWKGVSNDTDTVNVTTVSNEGLCGFPFEENREYLVYAYSREGDVPLRVDICGGTAPIESAQKDPDSPGNGYVPVQSGGGPVIEAEYSGYVPLIIGFGAAIAGVLTFLFRGK